MYQFAKDEVIAILIISRFDFNNNDILAINKFLGRECTPEEYNDFGTKLTSYRKCWVQTLLNIQRLK
jgi:hypothetical protein